MSGATTSVVADTHIVIWYLLNSAKLSQAATEALERCVAADETIRVSAHSLVELVYAVEQARNPFTEEDRQAVLGALAAEDSPFEVVPLTAEIANSVASVPRTVNADPGDRIAVATAEVPVLPTITRTSATDRSGTGARQ